MPSASGTEKTADREPKVSSPFHSRHKRTKDDVAINKTSIPVHSLSYPHGSRAAKQQGPANTSTNDRTCGEGKKKKKKRMKKQQLSVM